MSQAAANHREGKEEEEGERKAEGGGGGIWECFKLGFNPGQRQRGREGPGITCYTTQRGQHIACRPARQSEMG